MSLRLLTRRLTGRATSRTAGKPFSTSAAAPPKEPIAAADSHLNDQQPPDTPTARPKSLPVRLLKYTFIAALTGAAGSAAYATYAYTSDEVEKKATKLRELSKFPDADNASGLDKYMALVYSGALQVPLKAIELYIDIRRSIEEQIQNFTEPSSEKLLPDLPPQEQGVFTLVLDLNETLVYSDWKRERGWRTFKRPGVEAFLEHLSRYYEIVVYSDQLSMYVDPVFERLNQKPCIRYKLSRAATKYENGKHYRDLSKLNRDPARIIYISGNPESTLQRENYLYVKPWKLENDDTALLDLIPFLEYVAIHRPADIRAVLASYHGIDDIPAEFIKRHKEHERRMQEKPRSSLWRR